MHSSLVKLLKNIPALSDVDEDDLRDAAKKAVLMGYSKDSVIFNNGDESNHFYVIKSGMVEMVQKDYKGQLFQIEKHYPDNFFGEMALTSENFRELSARCIENSEVYAFNINDFKEFLFL